MLIDPKLYYLKYNSDELHIDEKSQIMERYNQLKINNSEFTDEDIAEKLGINIRRLSYLKKISGMKCKIFYNVYIEYIRVTIKNFRNILIED